MNNLINYLNNASYEEAIDICNRNEVEVVIEDGVITDVNRKEN